MTIKLTVAEIRFLTLLLRLVDLAPSKRMSEALLIALGEKSNWLTNEERARVKSRNDSRFANRIHNVVSHRDSKGNPIRHRLIEWECFGSAFRITDKGQKFLDDVGSKLGSTSRSDIDGWLAEWAATQKDRAAK